MVKSTQDTINEITAWLLSDARAIAETETVNQAIVDRLVAAGLPLARYTTGLPSLHPQVDSFSALWERGKELTIRRFRQAALDPLDVRRSPIFIAYETGEPKRYPLEGEPDPGEYHLLSEFRQAGMSEYFALPLPFGDGSFKVMTFATDRPGGFSDDDIAILTSLQNPLAVVLEQGYLRHMAMTLMETYVGPVAGRRVLDGAIRRGSGETFRTVIWFCDLKGFTSLSEKLPSQVLIDTLNAYFDATTSAIEAHGGEILKFIGDAVLAIFQPGDGREQEAARSALSAAREAIAGINAANTARAKAGQPPIECGIALHIGEVTYGNVGGQNRLDFTVIGPAVNLASRVEALTRDLKRPVLVSSDFAALVPDALEELGSFDLKGVSREQTVFAPAISTD